MVSELFISVTESHFSVLDGCFVFIVYNFNGQILPPIDVEHKLNQSLIATSICSATIIPFRIYCHLTLKMLTYLIHLFTVNNRAYFGPLDSVTFDGHCI